MTDDVSIAARAQRAKEALDAGDAALAARLFSELAAEQPSQPRHHFRLAQAKRARRLPDQALDHLSEAIRLAKAPDPRWLLMRCRLLIKVGQAEAAEQELTRLVEGWPDFPAARRLLVERLGQQGRYEHALAVFDAAPSNDSGDRGAALTARAGLLWGAWRFSEARECFVAAVEASVGLEALAALFQDAPRYCGYGVLYEKVLRTLLARLTQENPDGFAAPQALILATRIRFALGDTVAFKALAEALVAAEPELPLSRTVKAVLAALATPLRERRAREKVFVLGLEETGSKSLFAALRRLGFSGQYGTNEISGLLLGAEDADLFDALAGPTVANLYPVLAERYPSARFVITLRSPRDWRRAIAGRHDHPCGDVGEITRMTARLEADGHAPRWYASAFKPYVGHKTYEAAYEQHLSAVRGFFQDRPDRLLEFNASEGHGWDRLCAFLGRPARKDAFPHENLAARAVPATMEP